MQRYSATKRVIAGLVVTLVFSAAQAVEISDGYVRGMPPGQANTAAFLRIDNPGAKDWVLVSASSAAADSVEFHQHSMHQGMMSMREVKSVRVPAGGSFRFQPGDHHIMLIGLKQPLREGDSVELTLCAEGDDCVVVDLPVRSILNEHHHQHQ